MRHGRSFPTLDVVGEYETLAELVERGISIARFGDGEFKLMAGFDQMREPANKNLAKELRRIVDEPPERCLVGIPTLDPKGPKYLNWRRRARERFLTFLSPHVQYYSAFISRPDSAPWIRSRNYAEHFVSLWKGKRVALVAEAGTAICRLLDRTAVPGWQLFTCPHRETYQHIRALESALVTCAPDVAILSCGPAASCLAARLSDRMQALDVGSCGGFLLRELYGEGKETDDRTIEE